MQRVGAAAAPAGKEAKSELDYGDGVERFSGLKLTGRCIRPQRWDELMQSKKYTGFDRLAAAAAMDNPTSLVSIGIVYERSMPKTNSKGNRFSTWCLTDLAFPTPRLMTLILGDEAFQSWEEHPEVPVQIGTVFAILNPSPLPGQGEDGKKAGDVTRVTARVTHATQLVKLGGNPSLGICGCTKKDGTKCAMPCDRDRGPLVCCFHANQQNANKIKFLAQYQKNGGRVPTPASSDSSVFVVQSAPTKPQQGFRRGTGSGVQGSVLPPGWGAVPGNKPGAGAAPGSARAASAAARPVATPAAGTASARQPEGRPHSVGQSSTALPASFLTSQASTGEKGKQLKEGNNMTIPGSQSAREQQGAASAPSLPSRAEIFAQGGGRNRGPMSAEAFAQKLRATLPGGIPALDPNSTTPQRGPAPAAKAEPTPLKAALNALAAKEKAREQPSSRPATAPSIPAPTKPAEVVGEPPVISMAGTDAAPRGTKRKKGMSIRQIEQEFGKQVADEFRKSNPITQQIVRNQGSRFQDVVEEERAAQRYRKLGELEAQDAAEERMEAIMSIKVTAWKCRECFTSFESGAALELCRSAGHHLEQIQAERTRWECLGCRMSVSVLDRNLPSACRRCQSYCFEQVSLRSTRKRAPMERDLLLPRGEELKFVNSMPSSFKNTMKYGKKDEEADDYAGLYKDW